MGGDHAPMAPVVGAWRALRSYDDVEIVLVGDPEAIAREEATCTEAPADLSRRHVHDAPEVAGKHGDPVRAVRASKRVSARACVSLLKAGDVHGVINMGSTGAAVAAATLFGRRLKGVRRLGIAVPFPRPQGVSIVLDGGANPDSSAAELHQYAVMGTHYVRALFGIEQPRVGILSIGEERHKGNRFIQEVWETFEASPFDNFVGNVEPHALFGDTADVVVADGFVGNVALKAAEGMGEFVLATLRGLLGERGLPPEDIRTICRAIAERVDYTQYGGAPLLGIDGGYAIGHGRSGPDAYVNAVRLIRTFVARQVGDHIVQELQVRADAAANRSQA